MVFWKGAELTSGEFNQFNSKYYKKDTSLAKMRKNGTFSDLPLSADGSSIAQHPDL